MKILLLSVPIKLHFVLASPDSFLISMLMPSILPLNAVNLVLYCVAHLHLEWAVVDHRFQALIVIALFFHSPFEYTHGCVLWQVPVSYVLFQSQQHSKPFITTVLLLPAKRIGAHRSLLCV